jgi:hypothetical protein
MSLQGSSLRCDVPELRLNSSLQALVLREPVELFLHRLQVRFYIVLYSPILSSRNHSLSPG